MGSRKKKRLVSHADLVTTAFPGCLPLQDEGVLTGDSENSSCSSLEDRPSANNRENYCPYVITPCRWKGGAGEAKKTQKKEYLQSLSTKLTQRCKKTKYLKSSGELSFITTRCILSTTLFEVCKK